MRAILAISLIFGASLAQAEKPRPLLPETPKLIAEYIFYASSNSKTYGQFVTATIHQAKNLRDITAELKGHTAFDTQLPAFSWTEDTSILTIGKGSASTVIDFSKILKSDFIINGRNLHVPQGTSFAALKVLIKKLDGGKSAFLNLSLLPEAFAEDGAIQKNLDAIGTTIYSAFDNVDNCMKGYEAPFTSLCTLRSNANMIRSDVGGPNGPETGTIKEFTCDGDKFKSVSFGRPHDDFTYGLKMSYDGDKAATLEMMLGNNRSICTITIENDKVVSSEHTPDNSAFARGAYCRGRLASDPIRAESYDKVLDPGSNIGDIRRLSTSNVPVKRLIDCCKDTKCKQDMKQIVATPGPADGKNPGTTTQ